VVDLFSKVAEASGITFSTLRVPYAREVLMLENGTIDLAVALKTQVMERIAAPLVTLGPEEVILVSRPTARISSVSDLHGKVVAILRYSDYYPDIIEDPQVKKYPIISYELGLKMLLGARVDAVIGLRTSLSHAMGRLNLSQDQLGKIMVLRGGEVCVYLSRKFTDPTAIDRLTRSTQQVIRNDFYELARVHYGGTRINVANSSDMPR